MKMILASSLHPLRVTSVIAGEEHLPGSILLCPQLCWAARLTELDQVEVLSLTNGARMPLTVLVGETGEVGIPGGDVQGFEPGDPVAVRTWLAVRVSTMVKHSATLVRVDEGRNAPIEIRQRRVRPVRREPSFTPLLPPLVSFVPIDPP